jgi:hypothetical protein
LIFIKKGGEIRLREALATNPQKSGERCQNLIPGNREMIKINTGTMNQIQMIREKHFLPFMPMDMRW